MSTLKSGLISVLTRNGLDAELIKKASKIIDSYVAQTPSEAPVMPVRYEDKGLVRIGSTSEIRYVRDKFLRRIVIMKIGRKAESNHVFIEKVKHIAQLEHPNIVSVHDAGELEDGRPFYTVRLSSGLTLKAAIQRVWQGQDTQSWTFRRLIDSYRKVVSAAGYAQTLSVYHSNLSAENVTLGRYGEVLVTSWMSMDDMPSASPAVNIVESLGRILFHILTGSAIHGEGVIHFDLLNTPSPLCPPILAQLCRKACTGAITEHGILLRGIDDWLEGVQRKEKAESLLTESAKLRVIKSQLGEHAKHVKEEAQAGLLQIPYHASEEEKAVNWRKLDEANKTLEMAEMLEQEQIKNLNGAISYHAENRRAHLALSEVYWERVRRHKNDSDTTQHIREESRLLKAVQRLQKEHPERKRVEKYLHGPAKLTLSTSVPGAKVYWQRYKDDGMILQLGKKSYLGVTPLRAVDLMPGSYLLTISKEGYDDVKYPVCVKKGEHWDGCPPGESAPYPIWLPPKGVIPEGFIYIPAGWTILGGDTNPDSRGSYRQRVWVDSFAVAQYHVSNADYITYLNDLVAQGRADEAKIRAPNDIFKMVADQSNFYQAPDNTFSLHNPQTGSRMHPNIAVGNLDTSGMVAYLRWMSERTGIEYRLIRYDEWEKAARGVDERIYPWGNDCDPSLVNMNMSLRVQQGKPAQEMATFDRYPFDISPYGVRFMSGNCSDLVDSVFDRKPPVVNGPLCSRLPVSGQQLC